MAARRKDVVRPVVAIPGPPREPTAPVALDEEELHHDAFEDERPRVTVLSRDPVEIEEVDAAPVARRVEEIDVAVRSRRVEPAELLAPPTADPRPYPFRPEPVDDTQDEDEVVHPATAASSRGSRRDTIWETPSSPIVTPYRTSAASIVRF